MTEDLDKLRRGLRAAPPDTDPAVRAAHLARAMQAYDDLRDGRQESPPLPRPMSDRPFGAAFLTGVRKMLTSLGSRPTLAATTAVAAVLVGVMVTTPGLWRSPTPPAPPATLETDTAAAKVGTAPAEGRAADAPATSPATAPATAPVPPANGQPLAEVAREEAYAAAPSPEATAQTATGLEFAQRMAPETLADAGVMAAPDTEAFANAAPNAVKITAEDPVSTFSIDVDTASWSVVRSSLAAGALPPPEAVRIEEMVNYFPYDYAPPSAADPAPFAAAVKLFPTPWNPDTQLLRIGLQGRLPAIESRPPLDLVFLIDTSGSMEDANKLPLLRQSLGLMLDRLRPEDKVAIVTYAGSAGLVLPATAAADRAAISSALDRLSAGGSTAGAEGLALAYQVAEDMAADGRVGRILLATDGDFNVGVSDPEGLEAFVARKRETGVYLSVLGFGRGNLDDAAMQALAQNGNGTAAYIDTLAEAQKVLADQLTGALFPIADDVKVQVEFNPAAVAEYRLIGYETRALAREDFNNDRVDAGEIGAGRQVTALYEIVPAGSAGRLSDPLRYGTPEVQAGDATELGYLKLRAKAPGAATSDLIELAIPAAPGTADTDARFAAAIAGMGQLLTDPRYLGEWGWNDAIALAVGARGEDPFGYRAEAVQLMRLAESLSGR